MSDAFEEAGLFETPFFPKDSVPIWVEGSSDRKFWTNEIFVSDQKICRVRIPNDAEVRVLQKNMGGKEKPIKKNWEKVEFLAEHASGVRLGISDLDRRIKENKAHLVQSKFDLETSIILADSSLLDEVFPSEVSRDIIQTCCILGEFYSWHVTELKLDPHPNVPRKFNREEQQCLRHELLKRSIGNLLLDNCIRIDSSKLNEHYPRIKVTNDSLSEGIAREIAGRGMTEFSKFFWGAYIQYSDLESAQLAVKALSSLKNKDAPSHLKKNSVESVIEKEHKPQKDYFNGHHLAMLIEIAMDRIPNNENQFTTNNFTKKFSALLSRGSGIEKMQPVGDVIKFAEKKKRLDILKQEFRH
jgi:hypothetical protein